MRTSDLAADQEVVYELFSFIFWTLTIISFLKYASIVLKADDEGEGNFLIFSDCNIFIFQDWMLVEIFCRWHCCLVLTAV